MIDLILAGLGTGLFVFLSLFIVSFITLGVITGVIRLVAVLYRNLCFDESSAYHEQAV